MAGWGQQENLCFALQHVSDLRVHQRQQPQGIRTFIFQPHVAEQDPYPGTWEVEAGGTAGHSHPWLHSQSEASLGYMRLYLTAGVSWTDGSAEDSGLILSTHTAVHNHLEFHFCPL